MLIYMKSWTISRGEVQVENDHEHAIRQPYPTKKPEAVMHHNTRFQNILSDDENQ
jgi:hypothetical protein